MNHISEIITAGMVLIPLGAVPRAIYCVNKIMSDPEQEQVYRRRLKNLLVFVVIAECALDVIQIIQKYF